VCSEAFLTFFFFLSNAKKAKINNTERAFIDPRYRTRSYIEGKLVEILEQCWEHDPERRVDMFQVVSFLREVKRTATTFPDFLRQEGVGRNRSY
jgi:hypothetical protein